MNFLNAIEKRFLFSLVRIASLVSILVLIIALGLAAANYLVGPQVDTEVKYADLTLDPADPVESKSRPRVHPSSEIGRAILEKYLGSEELRKIVSAWVDAIPQEYRQDFVDNMTVILIEAEKDDPMKIGTAMDAYRAVKMQKLNSALSPDPAESFRGPIMALFALAALGLIGMFCLILVFLAVERNTRKSET